MISKHLIKDLNSKTYCPMTTFPPYHQQKWYNKKRLSVMPWNGMHAKIILKIHRLSPSCHTVTDPTFRKLERAYLQHKNTTRSIHVAFFWKILLQMQCNQCSFWWQFTTIHVYAHLTRVDIFIRSFLDCKIRSAEILYVVRLNSLRKNRME